MVRVTGTPPSPATRLAKPPLSNACRRKAATCGLLLGTIMAFGGCGGPTSKPVAEQPFTVEVSQDARRICQQAGVDLERLVADSAATVLSRLPHRGRISILVRLDASRSIPEVGVGGFTDPQDGDVFVWIDDTPPSGLPAALRTWVPATLAHELHHSSRIRMGPGYGSTLGEALVTEGLADHFAAEVFPRTPLAPWDHALSADQEHALWERAQPDLWGSYSLGDHQRWFFGGSGIPRWAGYTLGYRIVEAYLGTARSAAGAVQTKAQTVVEPYVRVARARPSK
jgi:Predicted Zn-dependent protease (DUF2268)